MENEEGMTELFNDNINFVVIIISISPFLVVLSKLHTMILAPSSRAILLRVVCNS